MNSCNLEDMLEVESDDLVKLQALALAHALAEAVKNASSASSAFQRGQCSSRFCDCDTLESIASSNHESEQEDDTIITFSNPACCICNGFYGPNFDDPVCATCHAFLFPIVAPDQQEVNSIKDESSDSDSGNDEPPENNFRTYSFIGGGDSPDWQMPEIPIPPVENLQQQLHRLSETGMQSEMNIEDLPNEVLMHICTYMDEITLWGFSQVSTRWKDIILNCVSNDRWRYYLLHRFIFYKPTYRESNWFEVYSKIMNSCCCLRCVRMMAAQEVPEREENPWRENRLRTEIRGLTQDPLEGIQAMPLDELSFHWQASLQGPIGSPYEGGLFFLYIQVPYTYPMSPPIVRFLTKIFHPNISRHGDIGIDSIQHNWSLALTIGKVLISIQSLLTDPYCDVCMEPEIGRLYITNRMAFDRQARLWTWRYAMHDLLPN